jgi:hypothetical protein
MRTADLEKRLTAIERELASLRSERTQPERRHPIQSLEAIHGAFEDDEAFREAMRLGRRWRQGTTPTRRAPRKPRK